MIEVIVLAKKSQQDKSAIHYTHDYLSWLSNLQQNTNCTYSCQQSLLDKLLFVIVSLDCYHRYLVPIFSCYWSPVFPPLRDLICEIDLWQKRVCLSLFNDYIPKSPPTIGMAQEEQCPSRLSPGERASRTLQLARAVNKIYNARGHGSSPATGCIAHVCPAYSAFPTCANLQPHMSWIYQL